MAGRYSLTSPWFVTHMQQQEGHQHRGLVSCWFCPGICWVPTWLLSLETSSDLSRQQVRSSCGKEYKKDGGLGAIHPPWDTLSALLGGPMCAVSSTAPDQGVCPSKRCCRRAVLAAAGDSQTAGRPAAGSAMACTGLPETFWVFGNK